MSQFKFPLSLQDGEQKAECMLGYDTPMQTFFAQVYLVDENGERVQDIQEVEGKEYDAATLLWLGTSSGEFKRFEQMSSKLVVESEPIEVPEKILRELTYSSGGE